MTSTRATTTDYRNLLKRYASYAPNYDQRWGRYSAATLSKTLEAIPASGEAALLDVACGTGLLAQMLLHRHPHLTITGVDISPQMLQRASQRIAPGNGVSWKLGHAEALPVEAAQFDILTCTNAFHLVQDAAAALAQFRAALKPHGTLVLVDWCRDFPVMKFRTAVLRFSDRQRRQIRTVSELALLVESAGFQVESRERFRTGLWGLMCIVGRAMPIDEASPARAQPERTPRPHAVSRP